MFTSEGKTAFSHSNFENKWLQWDQASVRVRLTVRCFGNLFPPLIASRQVEPYICSMPLNPIHKRHWSVWLKKWCHFPIPHWKQGRHYQRSWYDTPNSCLPPPLHFRLNSGCLILDGRRTDGLTPALDEKVLGWATTTPLPRSPINSHWNGSQAAVTQDACRLYAD